MSDVLPPTTRWLDEHLDEWIEAGIVDEAQRSAIESYERGRGRETVVARRLGIGAEVAAYLGSVLALTGGAMAIGESFERWSLAPRLALGLVIMAVGLGIGHILFGVGEPGTDRLGGFVTTLGVGGLALSTGLVADEIAPREGGWIALAVGASVLAVSLVLWRNRDRPLQLATSVVGFGVTGAAVTDLSGQHWWVCGLVFIGAGALLSLLGHARRAHPSLIALLAGGVGAFVGAQMLADVNRHLGPVTALAVALVAVVYAVHADLTPLLVLAVLGAAIATGALLETTFNSALSALFVALIGLALVIIVITRSARRRQRPAPG